MFKKLLKYFEKMETPEPRPVKQPSPEDVAKAEAKASEQQERWECREREYQPEISRRNYLIAAFRSRLLTAEESVEIWKLRECLYLHPSLDSHYVVCNTPGNYGYRPSEDWPILQRRFNDDLAQQFRLRIISEAPTKSLIE